MIRSNIPCASSQKAADIHVASKSNTSQHFYNKNTDRDRPGPHHADHPDCGIIKSMLSFQALSMDGVHESMHIYDDDGPISTGVTAAWPKGVIIGFMT
jgi:hypothetical protein